MRKPRSGAAVCLLALAACSGGTESGAPAPTRSATLRGVVVDGYLEGARVFLDLNGNYVRDDGEPVSTATDARGAFTLALTGITAEQRTRAFVVADVPEDAKDADDRGATLKEAGKRAFTLLAPLPREAESDAGVSAAVVSPLSALVAGEMIAAGVDVDEAQSAVRERLGLGERPLLADFVATPDPVLQNIARVTALTLGDALRAEREVRDGGAPAEPPGQRVVDALESVRAQLPQMVDVLNLRDGGAAPAPDVLRAWIEQRAAERDADVGTRPPIALPDPRDPPSPTHPMRDASVPVETPPVRDAGVAEDLPYPDPRPRRDAGGWPTESEIGGSLDAGARA